MQKTLYQMAKEYVDVLNELEKTDDPLKATSLEEQRILLHGLFIDALNEQGIKFKDREHATRIAIRIAAEEL